MSPSPPTPTWTAISHRSLTCVGSSVAPQQYAAPSVVSPQPRTAKTASAPTQPTWDAALVIDVNRSGGAGGALTYTSALDCRVPYLATIRACPGAIAVIRPVALTLATLASVLDQRMLALGTESS